MLALVLVMLSGAMASADVLRIEAPANSYAHIARSIPVSTASEVVAEARIKVDVYSGSSWTPSLGFLWSGNDHVKLGYQGSGLWRFGSLAIPAFDGLPTTGAFAADDGGWVTVRLRVTESLIQVYIKGAGDWELIAEGERPDALSVVPAEVVVGKSYGTGEAPYDAPHLANSYSAPGNVGVSTIADFTVTVDGTVVLDGFGDLSEWDFYIDPNLTAQTRITSVAQ